MWHVRKGESSKYPNWIGYRRKPKELDWLIKSFKRGYEVLQFSHPTLWEISVRNSNVQLEWHFFMNSFPVSPIHSLRPKSCQKNGCLVSPKEACGREERRQKSIQKSIWGYRAQELGQSQLTYMSSTHDAPHSLLAFHALRLVFGGKGLWWSHSPGVSWLVNGNKPWEFYPRDLIRVPWGKTWNLPPVPFPPGILIGHMEVAFQGLSDKQMCLGN